MEPGYWMVHGNLKNKRINYVNEKMFVDTVRIESADMKNILFLFHEEPNTRSLQLPHIPVTAFSQTDLFLV